MKVARHTRCLQLAVSLAQADDVKVETRDAVSTERKLQAVRRPERADMSGAYPDMPIWKTVIRAHGAVSEGEKCVRAKAVTRRICRALLSAEGAPTEHPSTHLPSTAHGLWYVRGCMTRRSTPSTPQVSRPRLAHTLNRAVRLAVRKELFLAAQDKCLAGASEQFHPFVR